MTMTFFISWLANNDDDDVQTFMKNSVGIANVHL